MYVVSCFWWVNNCLNQKEVWTEMYRVQLLTGLAHFAGDLRLFTILCPSADWQACGCRPANDWQTLEIAQLSLCRILQSNKQVLCEPKEFFFLFFHKMFLLTCSSSNSSCCQGENNWPVALALVIQIVFWGRCSNLCVSDFTDSLQVTHCRWRDQQEMATVSQHDTVIAWCCFLITWSRCWVAILLKNVPGARKSRNAQSTHTLEQQSVGKFLWGGGTQNRLFYSRWSFAQIYEVKNVAPPGKQFMWQHKLCKIRHWRVTFCPKFFVQAKHRDSIT